jgi:DNA-binding MarR family transcriptional regulator
MPAQAMQQVPDPPGYYQGGAQWKIDESIGYLVRKLSHSFQLHIDARMQARGLTHSQWAPLLLIANGKGDTASALARELGVDTGATTRMVDRLEAKGLLNRLWCEQDRRVVHLKLTEQGRALTETIPDALAEVLNHHLRGFSRAEVQLMTANLRRMLDNGREAMAAVGNEAHTQMLIEP